MKTNAPKPGLPVFSGLKNVLSGLGAIFSGFFAAAVVASAIENRRQPDAADLRRLGMEGVRFNLNF